MTEEEDILKRMKESIYREFLKETLFGPDVNPNKMTIKLNKKEICGKNVDPSRIFLDDPIK